MKILKINDVPRCAARAQGVFQQPVRSTFSGKTMGIEEKLTEEVTKLAPEIYKDLVKPAAQEVGVIAGRSAKALLSPVRAFLWSWERIEQLVVDGVNSRIDKIPEEQRKTPDPEIAVPLIQALTYTAQNDTLREMYLNLLANSMDNVMDKNVHPSFVNLIKQMNALDAKVFERLAREKGYQKVINPNIALKEPLHNLFFCFPHPIKSTSYKREFVGNWGYAEVP